MSCQISIPPLHKGETKKIQFDFTSDLSVGETVVVGSCAVSVYSGTDASPSSIVSGAASVSGNIVTQGITSVGAAGVLGVIYELLCTVTTTQQVLTKSAFLAIVPDVP